MGWSVGFLPTGMSVPSLPSFLSAVSTAHLRRNLSVPISGVAMCDAGRDVFRCLGLNPEQTCILLLNGSMCVCVCVYLLSLMIFSCCMSSSGNNHVFGIKTCFAATICPAQGSPYKTTVRPVPNRADIKLQASPTWAYILMKPWIHLFTSWLTLHSRVPKSKGFQNTLQDLKIRWDKLLIFYFFFSHDVALALNFGLILIPPRGRYDSGCFRARLQEM